MKEKRIFVFLIFIITMLFSSSAISGLNITDEKSTEKPFSNYYDPIEIYVGKMTIDCEWDSIACDVDIIDNPYQKLNIDSETTAKIIFYADWKIVNEKATSKEKWIFNMTLRNGNVPDSEIIDNKCVIINDTFAIPDNQEGVIYFDEVYLTRDDFEKHYFHQKPDERKFRMTLECIYYLGPWVGGELEEESQKDLWTIGRVDLNNDKPSKPELSGDIDEGETGDISETYIFTARGSYDPDGDKISYVFSWHDGQPSDETDFMDGGGTGEMSHKWNDETGLHEVSVYSKDRFGAISSSEKITFTLPRSRVIRSILYYFIRNNNNNLDLLLNLINL